MTRLLTLLPTDKITIIAPEGSELSAVLASGKRRLTVQAKPVVVPVPPTPLPGAPLAAGENWQTKLDANPPGTLFRVLPGVHKRQSIKPRDGQVIDGGGAATMDGENTTEIAIGGNAKNVTIRNLTVRNYKTPGQRCAIHLDRDISTASGWLLENLLVHTNAFGGVALGDNCTMRGGVVHTNGYIGVKASGTTDAKFIGVEVYANHTRPDDPYVEAGGSKFAHTKNLLVQNCNFHHNKGAGIWTDGENVDAMIEGNTVADNDGPGIFHEISYDAVIRRNKVFRNGIIDGGWIWHAGILIACSSGVEAYENELDGNRNGVSLIQQDRGPKYITRDNFIHDNEIYNTLHSHGVAEDVGDKAIFLTRNNRFERNHYRKLGGGFAWDGDGKTWAQWQAAGNDLQGSYQA
jgi:parallel beta-helix repeat protein